MLLQKIFKLKLSRCPPASELATISITRFGQHGPLPPVWKQASQVLIHHHAANHLTCSCPRRDRPSSLEHPLPHPCKSLPQSPNDTAVCAKVLNLRSRIPVPVSKFLALDHLTSLHTPIVAHRRDLSDRTLPVGDMLYWSAAEGDLNHSYVRQAHGPAHT